MQPPPLPCQTTPPAPAQSSGKMKGCPIAAAVIVLGFFGLALIGSMLPKPPPPDPAIEQRRQEQEKARQLEKIAANEKSAAEWKAAAEKEEQAAKDAALKKAQDVPGNVEELAKEILGKDYRNCIVQPDGKGGWTIHINGHAVQDYPGVIRRNVIQLAARCHPAGMIVSDFSVGFQGDFTDGLGNISQGGLLRVRLRRSIASRVNWSDTDNIDFATAFETEVVHRSFKAKWEADQ